jgi:pyruvate ferredoxin oxidoreductase gamma subunit
MMRGWIGRKIRARMGGAPEISPAPERRPEEQNGGNSGEGTLSIRLHGRGGQGVVTSAELLSLAAFLDGHQAQAFPSFGSERTGAPVVAFCRIGDRPIRTHEPISRPDAVVIGDPTLLHQVDVFAGLEPGGLILINTSREVEELGLSELEGEFRVLTVPASELASKHLGRPLPNAALVGALAAATGVVSIEATESAIGRRFSGAVAEGNAAAARAGYDVLRDSGERND